MKNQLYPTLRHFLAAIGCATMAISSASAQTNGTWTQDAAGTYDWSTTTNWLDDIVAGGTDATASFTESAGGAQTASLDIDVTLGNLTLDRNQNLTINTDTEDPKIFTLDTTTGTPTINVASDRTLSINTVLAGSDGLLLQGGGRLNLVGLDNANPNTLTGGVTVIGGIVEAVEVRANSIGDGPISLSEGGELWLRGGNNSTGPVSIGTGGGTLRNRGNNTFQTTGILTGSGTLTFTTPGGGGGRNWWFNSTDNDFTGGFVLTNVNHNIQVNSLADSTNNITFNAAGTFRYGSGAITALTLNDRAFELNNSGGTIDNANTTHAITINTDLIATGSGVKTLTLSGASGPTNVFAGLIADETDEGEGTVALTKSGASTWVLGGDNTYSGATTITAGTLLINGDSSAATGAVAVDGTSTLGGSGTLGGSVTVAEGAKIAPGTSVGTLAILGDLDISAMAGGAGTLNYELGPIAASDRIAVTGALDIGSGALGFSDFDFSKVGDLEEGVYTLITSGGIVGSLDATDLQGTIDEQEFTLGISGGDIVLTAGAPSGTPFEQWAGTGVTFDGDESGDGVSNGMAFLLGAGSPNDNALGLLPTVTETGGDLVLTFDMLKPGNRGDATLSIEHSSDLGITDTWTTVAVPDANEGPTSGVTFVVGTGVGTTNPVTATISSTEASATGKLFGRLKAANP